MCINEIEIMEEHDDAFFFKSMKKKSKELGMTFTQYMHSDDIFLIASFPWAVPYLTSLF